MSSIHHSFTYHLLKKYTPHTRHIPSTIISKEIYPVASNPLDEIQPVYIFENKSKYCMVR